MAKPVMGTTPVIPAGSLVFKIRAEEVAGITGPVFSPTLSKEINLIQYYKRVQVVLVLKIFFRHFY
jgi:hypothetical protein